jgi:protein-S-isoprenylcysteine O-methyltransferase Ste14
MLRLISYAVVSAAFLVGGGALVAFGVFLFVGPLKIVAFGIGDKGALLVDTGLSLLFFIQHSGMIRKSSRRRVIRLLPEAYFSALYAIASGLVLMVVVLLWQKTDTVVAEADGMPYWALRLLFLVAVGGFYWGSSTLGSFDPFGGRAIIKHLRSAKPKPMPFTVKGPYRWVRHPLYFFTLLMIWTSPYLTADRLLFNVLWTAWLVVGSILEERDLVETFGDEYRQYQSEVPMLIPINPADLKQM